MTNDDSTKPGPGRPRSGARAERERRILDAALDELVEHGYDRVTMLGIARRAGASKETLYNWFGNKDGLFAELIRHNADASAERIQAAFDADTDPHDTLVGYATGLLTLLTSPGSVALNRAAAGSPELATALLANGRHRTGPVVEQYLASLDRAGYLPIDDAATAFRLLYGLVVRDTQIRVLLGESAPPPSEVALHAEAAIEQFEALLQRSVADDGAELS